MLFRVVQGRPAGLVGDSVVVVFRCPEGYGHDFFYEGRQYAMELVKDAPKTGFDWSTVNPYADLGLPTYWATSCWPRFFSRRQK